MDRLAALVENRQVDPAEVAAEAGGPDHAGDGLRVEIEGTDRRRRLGRGRRRGGGLLRRREARARPGGGDRAGKDGPAPLAPAPLGVASVGGTETRAPARLDRAD